MIFLRSNVKASCLDFDFFENEVISSINGGQIHEIYRILFHRDVCPLSKQNSYVLQRKNRHVLRDRKMTRNVRPNFGSSANFGRKELTTQLRTRTFGFCVIMQIVRRFGRYTKLHLSLSVSHPQPHSHTAGGRCAVKSTFAHYDEEDQKKKSRGEKGERMKAGGGLCARVAK